MKSGIGIWNKVCLSVACFGIALCVPGVHLFAQDSFREFDRKMVVTPAELYDALSTLQPTKKQKQIDPQRLKEIEKAGRDFLSKLSPEDQDKAWEFAEKYLRKNGVDPAAAQKLMQEFGLPPEMQNELSKQLRKFSNNRDSDPGSNGGAQDRDAISQLMQKAREELRRANLQDGADDRAVPSNRPYSAQGSKDAGNDQRVPGESQIPGRGANRPNGETGQGDKLKSPSEQRANDQANQPTGNRDRSGSRAGTGTRQRPERSDRRSETDKRSRPMMPRNRSRGNNKSTEAELEKLRKQLEDSLGDEGSARKTNRGPGGEAGGKDSGSSGGPDWKKLIEDLAEKEEKGIGEKLARQINDRSSAALNKELQDRSSKDQANKSMFDRLLSGAFDSKKNSQGSDSSGRGNANANGRRSGSGKNEKVGTRFDRLLVEAVDRTLDRTVDRTLDSDGEQGVSEGVSGMFGKLIERFQERESKKREEQTRESGRSDSRRNSGGRRSRNSSDEAGAEKIARNESRESSRSSNSGGGSGRGSAPRSQTSAGDTSSFNPRGMLDKMPDLKSINPTHVFMFFAIAGMILFVGYMLTQSLAPDELATRKRKVIKQVRNRTIKTPKDLVETVDMFLLAKFGIKSSWWNAKLAQRVLDSGSPQLQSQVDDLFRDYVRARYMRNDVAIPDADQDRFKQTLEELSKLDIKPDSSLGFVPAKVVNPAVSLEG